MAFPKFRTKRFKLELGEVWIGYEHREFHAEGSIESGNRRPNAQWQVDAKQVRKLVIKMISLLVVSREYWKCPYIIYSLVPG